MADFRILLTDWAHEQARLSRVRRAVFIDEQGVPETLEWNADDAGAVQLLAVDDQGEAIGCARLLPDGHIGRMAVLPAWRGRGVGRALLAAALDAAQARGHALVQLGAQTHAAAFYARAGFVAVGAEYVEAGIPHVVMHKELA
ncbi:MAG: GNAT family N-acetyltransferase [Thiobacillus sp.]|nr:MAG: GNAT family N-acetyltransferase [Hydrogenophilales bacterium 16-64-40]OZA33260.1 MAG: GNAT family N-acetyltransferase [Hydrogenophilales bacterium 17-64-65]HQT34244.1 GNAT family N-acetyltransferase [Thiobacillus sp.]